jgi:hypothetical protein
MSVRGDFDAPGVAINAAHLSQIAGNGRCADRAKSDGDAILLTAGNHTMRHGHGSISARAQLTELVTQKTAALEQRIAIKVPCHAREFIFAGGLFFVALTQRLSRFAPSTDTNHQPTNQP